MYQRYNILFSMCFPAGTDACIAECRVAFHYKKENILFFCVRISDVLFLADQSQLSYFIYCNDGSTQRRNGRCCTFGNTEEFSERRHSRCANIRIS